MFDLEEHRQKMLMPVQEEVVLDLVQVFYGHTHHHLIQVLVGRRDVLVQFVRAVPFVLPLDLFWLGRLGFRGTQDRAWFTLGILDVLCHMIVNSVINFRLCFGALSLLLHILLF